jgi:phosphatidylglycerol:prolipoprotein diacylglycerol transferase
MPWQHDIDPIALQLGPIVVRWYALTYLGGILLGFWLMIRRVRGKLPWLKRETLEWGLFWILLGIVIAAAWVISFSINGRYGLIMPGTHGAFWPSGRAACLSMAA